jgi:hypothetical protein
MKCVLCENTTAGENISYCDECLSQPDENDYCNCGENTPTKKDGYEYICSCRKKINNR